MTITDILEQTVAFNREHGHWPARGYLSRETVSTAFPVADPFGTRAEMVGPSFGRQTLGVTEWLFDDTLPFDILRLE